MKLRLPHALLTALFAGVCAATTAEGSTTLGGQTYSGTVYTWGNTATSQADLAYGSWIETTENNGELVYGTSHTAWTGDIINIIANGGTFNFTSDLNTFRFDATKGTNGNMKYTFQPLAVAGFIVESGANYTITAGAGSRAVHLGNGTTTAARSDIKDNFTVSSTNNAINLQGTQTLNISTDKTFTLNSGTNNIAFANSADVTLSGGGTISFAGAVSAGADSMLTLTAESTAEFLQNSTIANLTNNGGTIRVAGEKTLTISGNVYLDTPLSVSGAGSVALTGNVRVEAPELAYTYTGTGERAGSGFRIYEASSHRVVDEDSSSSVTTNTGTQWYIGNDNVTAAAHYESGVFTLDGTTASTGRYYVNQNLNYDATEMLGSNKDTTLYVAEGKKLTFNANESVKASFGGPGQVEVAAGKTLTISLQDSDVGDQGAVTPTHTTQMGNVVLNAGSELKNNSNYQRSTRVFDSLTVNAGTSAAKISQWNWNTWWDIAKLQGDGDLRWESTSTHSETNIMFLREAGTFSGELELYRNKDASSRKYQAFIQIDHADALRNGVIKLTGTGANSGAGLALNVSQVNLKGLSGNANSAIFAGAAPTAPTALPTSATGATSTLVLDVDNNKRYEYAGVVQSGINITKNGAGTQIFNGNLSNFNGSVTINGGTLGIGNGLSSQLTFARNVSGEGTLLFSNGSIKYTGTASNTGGVLIDGGATVELANGGEESKLKGTVTVKTGSTLKLTAGDATGWNDSKAQRISQLFLDGGTLTVANTGGNQTFAGSGSEEGSIILKNSTINHTSDAEAAGNIDLFTTTSKIAVLAADDATESAPTVSTIDATLTLRRNGWTEFSVAENAKLNVSQTIRVSDDISGRGNYDNKLNKTGAGAMNVTANVEAKEILLSGGSLTIDGNVGKSNRSSKITIGTGNGSLELGGKNNLLTHVDADNNGTANGSVLFKSGSVSTVATNNYNGIWMRDATHTKLLFEKGSAVKTDDLVLSGRTDKKNGEMYAVSGATKYTAGATNAKLTDMILEATANKTVSNVLVDSSLKVNTEGVTLTENRAENTSFVGIYAENGIINLLNKTNVSVADLTISSGAQVGVYQGNSTPATPSTSNEAAMSVSGTLTAGNGATLNANLTMKGGSTIAVSGENGLHMGSSVTLEQGNGKIKLSDDIISGLNSLTVGNGLTLFSGVDSFNGSTADSSAAASTYFDLSNVTRPYDFIVKFEAPADSQQGGAVFLWMETPEPATVTLSLLALAALAARRKRK